MQKLTNLRWYIAALLFTSTVINYIDRQTLSVVKPRIMADLHLSQTAYAHVVQGWLLAYTVMYVVSGFLVDRWGTRKALAAFVAWWSFANLLHVFTRTASQLRFFQVLLGIGEPGNYNAASRATSEWFPAKERAFVNGLVNAGSAIGAIVAMPLVAWLVLQHGWRYAFVATGLLGFVWMIPWLVFYKLPQQHASITDEELTHILSGPAALCGEGTSDISSLLRRPDVWGLLLTRFFSDPVWWFYLFWLPGFLQEQRGFTLTQIAIFGWLPYLASDVGGLSGGWLSDRLIARTGSALKARLWPMLVCAAVMPVSLLVPRTQTRGSLIAVLCVVTFAHMAWKTNLMTITNDLYPAECIGKLSGILMLGSGIGGFLFQSVIARLVEADSYSAIFTLMGFMHPIAFVVVIFFLYRAGLLPLYMGKVVGRFSFKTLASVLAICR